MKKVYVLYNENEDEIKVYDSWEKAFNKFNEIADEYVVELDEYIYSTCNGLDRVDYCNLFIMYIETCVVE